VNIYLVGGAVRDTLLGLPVYERDYVVVGAKATELQALGYTQLEPNFPVFQHPETGCEYALARRETKTGYGYKGFSIEVGPDVTLEEDLARRDLTINAIAQDKNGHLIDPFHGQADIKIRRLRHITPAFQEDPVRLLRLARFAARFRSLGFRVTHETYALVKLMASHPELVSLFPTRFTIEMTKALATDDPWCFFDLLQRCGALTKLLPTIANDLETPPIPHTNSSVTFLTTVMQRVAALTTDSKIRFAAFIGGTAANSSATRTLCRDLKVEKSWYDLAILNQTWPIHKVMQATPDKILELLKTQRLLNHPEKLESLIQVWIALDPVSGSTVGNRLRMALEAVRQVKAATFISQGLTGAALGQALSKQRLKVISDILKSL